MNSPRSVLPLGESALYFAFTRQNKLIRCEDAGILAACQNHLASRCSHAGGGRPFDEIRFGFWWSGFPWDVALNWRVLTTPPDGMRRVRRPKVPLQITLPVCVLACPSNYFNWVYKIKRRKITLRLLRFCKKDSRRCFGNWRKWNKSKHILKLFSLNPFFH